MTFSLKTWIDRSAGRRAALPSLDLLVSAAARGQALEERLNWLAEVRNGFAGLATTSNLGGADLSTDSVNLDPREKKSMASVK